MIKSDATSCPACGEALTHPDQGLAWCPACEWNLGRYDREVEPPRGWRWLDWLGHRMAFRLDGALFQELSTHPPDRPGWTPTRVLLVAFSALLGLVMAGCLVVGVWLVVDDFPSRSLVVGLALILLTVVLRPRLGRRPARNRILRRDEAPTLFALVDRVATAVGTAAPRVIAVDETFNAATGRFGLRRRTVLLFGMPLWITLGPAERVALLAHELGHQINGDPTRGLFVQPALGTFHILASSTGANRSIREVVFARHGIATVFQFFLEVVLWMISRVFLLIHVGLSALGMRDHQRAEYLADQVAVEVAGTTAMVSLLDRFILIEPIARLVAYRAETAAPDSSGALVQEYHESVRSDLPRLGQLTMRHTSLWDSHPPTGLRARMVRAWPTRAAEVRSSPSESARIDVELAGWYRAVHRLVLGTRDFRGKVGTETRSR